MWQISEVCERGDKVDRTNDMNSEESRLRFLKTVNKQHVVPLQ